MRRGAPLLAAALGLALLAACGLPHRIQVREARALLPLGRDVGAAVGDLRDLGYQPATHGPWEEGRYRFRTPDGAECYEAEASGKAGWVWACYLRGDGDRVVWSGVHSFAYR